MKASQWALLVPNSHQGRAACGASRTQEGPGRSILTPKRGLWGKSSAPRRQGRLQ